MRVAAVALFMLAVAGLLGAGMVSALSGGDPGDGGGGAAGKPTQTREPKAPPDSGPKTPAPPAAPEQPAASAEELNALGFELIQQGRYVEALAPLERAVDSYAGGEGDLTYAYALFNLGHALRMAPGSRLAAPSLGLSPLRSARETFATVKDPPEESPAQRCSSYRPT